MKIGCPMCSALGIGLLSLGFLLIIFTNDTIVQIIGFATIISAYIIPPNVKKKTCTSDRCK